MLRQIVCLSRLIFIGQGAKSDAEGVGDCRDALVKSTYRRNDGYFHDWRLAQSVSKDTYDTIQKEASASATIYGIPISGGWKDFRTHVEQLAEKYHESLRGSQIDNVLWPVSTQPARRRTLIVLTRCQRSRAMASHCLSHPRRRRIFR